MPVNALIVRALLNFYLYYGDNFKIECPTGSGNLMNLFEASKEISNRLIRIFLRDERGRRPVYGGTEKFQNDPFWRENILFYEYFHGDNGAGLGASHQTGWTGLVAKLIELYGFLDAKRVLEAEGPHSRESARRWVEKRDRTVHSLRSELDVATRHFRAGTGVSCDRHCVAVCDSDTIKPSRIRVLEAFLEELPRGGSQGQDVYASSCRRRSPSAGGCVEASPMPNQEISPTCSGCSSLLDVEENYCEVG
jgi:hypothetical protein